MGTRAALLWLLALALAGPAASVRAAERIARFDVAIEVAPDASLRVTEEIAYDFGEAERRGIYRDVPVRYSRRGAPDHSITLELLSVTDGGGLPQPFRVSRQGSHRRIRIGDPDRTVTGLQHYRIRYRARLAMLHFEAHDEVYWNVTGNGWQVPIEAASAHVALAETPGALLDLACFTGPLGALRTACSADREPDGARFATRERLAPGEGLTVVVALPKGHVTPPTAFERLMARVAPWVSAWLLLPLATLLGLHGYWKRAGRDPGQGAAIPARYEPPEGLEPAEVGTLLDERADLDDVTATILQLAVRGHLQIRETSSAKFLFFERKDYELVKLEKPETLKKHQRLLLKALFTGRDRVLVSSLRNEFYEELPPIRKALYGQLSGPGGFFAAPPDQVRTRYGIAGGVVAVLGVFGIGALRPVAGVALLLSGLAILAYSRVMPRRTRRGRRAYEEILGLREFLERVDRDRLERLGANTRERFEALLPYAIVLGVADAWADAFAEIYTEPPSWYHGYDPHGPFRPNLFVSDVGRSLDTIGQTLSSQPSRGGSSSGFGGGGFSGGGFGGGGGGSW
ncbi:MAG: DUF2207 domain-containing protein [Myxococcales bacterium]|nr:DUF2207 domain-containing protein [Myxococcales bacterium]